MTATSSGGRLARAGYLLALLSGLAALVLVAMGWLWQPASGPGALVTILLPHATIAALVVATLGLALDRRVRSGVVVAGLIVVALARFGSEWLSLPSGDAGRGSIDVLTWNLEARRTQPDGLVEALLVHDADIVTLQELTRASAATLEGDSRIRDRYPFRQFIPNDGARGLGILSRFPGEPGMATQDPPMQVAVLDVGMERPLRLVNAHPLPGTIETRTPLRIPVSFDGAARDRSLERIRRTVDDLLEPGEPLIAAGDFNVAPTEPAYGPLSRGLLDVHVEAGIGTGWTWRPSRLERLPLALLRIDYIFVNPILLPVSVRVDCSRAGDHCAMLGRLQLPVSGSSPVGATR